MTCGEPRAMHARRERIGEVQRRGQCSNGLAVAFGAELLAVTRLTHVARRRGARARVACGVVVVALETGRHRWLHVLTILGGADVTAYAVTFGGRRVLAVIEHQVL